jgi:hypothetical protein
MAEEQRRADYSPRPADFPENCVLTDIHRMTALARMKLPLLKDFGNAKSST